MELMKLLFIMWVSPCSAPFCDVSAFSFFIFVVFAARRIASSEKKMKS